VQTEDESKLVPPERDQATELAELDQIRAEIESAHLGNSEEN